MKTSYYGNLRNLDKNKYYFVCISRGCPVKELMDELPCLSGFNVCPDSITLNNYKEAVKSGNKDIIKLAEEEYIRDYTSKLDTCLSNGVLKTMIDSWLYKEKQLNKEVVLLCYESKDKFCHRHILADFINRVFGETYKINVKEI